MSEGEATAIDYAVHLKAVAAFMEWRNEHGSALTYEDCQRRLIDILGDHSRDRADVDAECEVIAEMMLKLPGESR